MGPAPRSLARRRGEAGYTLAELTIFIAVSTAIIFTLGTFTTNLRRTTDFLNEELLRQGDARLILTRFVREVRAAVPSSCGEYPIVEVSANQFVFFTNADPDVAIERVRYTLRGSNLERAVIQPREPIDCLTSGTYDLATEEVAVVLNNLVNATQNRPLFLYFAGSTDASTPLAEPVTPRNVQVVEATLIIDADQTRPPAALRLSSKVGIRSVQTGAAQASPTPTAESQAGTVNAFSKTDGRPTVPVGGALVYHLALRNTGRANADGVDITDTLPRDVTLVAGSTSHSGTYDAATRTVRWDDLTIPPVTTTASQGLVGYWRLDDGNGVYAADHSGNENVGQMRGRAGWASEVPVTNFRNLGSGTFNGGTSEIRVPDQSAIRVGGGDFTVALWVHPFSLGSWKMVFEKASSASRNELHFAVHAASQVVRIGVGNTSTVTAGVSENIQNSVWQHYVVRRKGADVDVYRNGTRVATVTGRTATGTNLAPLSFGRSPTGQGSTWDGRLDDIRVYNRALSNREIQSLAQGNGNQDNLSFKATVNAGVADGTELENEATVAVGTTRLTDEDETHVRATTVALASPTKTDSVSTINPGQTLTYQVTLTNDGDGAATEVNVRDAVPANTTFVSGSITGGGTYDAAANTIAWSNLTVNPFSTLTIGFRVTVNGGVADGTVLTNQADVTAPGGYARSATDTTTVRVPVVTGISASKSDGTSTTAPGRELRYRITVRNQTTTALTGVGITDQVPQHTSLVSGSITGGGTYDAATNTITWTGLSVSANSSRTVEFRVRVASDAADGTRITNRATVSAPALPAPLTAEDVTTVSTSPILRAPTKTDNRTVAGLGATLTYQVSIRNDGGGAASGVAITDAIPTHTTFVSGSITGGGTYDAAANTVRWSDKTINAFSTLTVSFKVTVNATAPDGARITNRADATGPNGYSGSGTDTTTVEAPTAE